MAFSSFFFFISARPPFTDEGADSVTEGMAFLLSSPMPPSCTGMIRESLLAVRDGTAEGVPLRDEKYGYYGDPETMKQYFFDGFSIIYKE